MIFKFSQYIIDVDIEKTKQFYNSQRFISEGCNCSGCCNFEKVADYLAPEITSFFNNLGIEVKKITEIYVNCTNADNTLYYAGFTHVCGEIISGESAWVTNSSNLLYLDEDKMFNVTDDFKVHFQNECHLLKEGFPSPAIQLEIIADLPWVLNEVNNYPKDRS